MSNVVVNVRKVIVEEGFSRLNLSYIITFVDVQGNQLTEVYSTTKRLKVLFGSTLFAEFADNGEKNDICGQLTRAIQNELDANPLMFGSIHCLLLDGAKEQSASFETNTMALIQSLQMENHILRHEVSTLKSAFQEILAAKEFKKQLKSSDLDDRSLQASPTTLQLLPESEGLPVASISVSSCSAFERETEDFIRMVQPRESQSVFRQAAVELLKSHVQKALKCNAFDISFAELKCFLPDDPIRLTVVVTSMTKATWHKVVYDRLMIVSGENSSHSHHHAPTSQTREDLLAIRDIRLTSDGDTFKILGSVQSVPFELVANGQIDLLLLAFFEEVSCLIGNDQLLKRSVLLIRSWWRFETIIDNGRSPREYLPDIAIWLMTIALFNVNYTKIQEPLQALYLFLEMYSAYDGNHEVITIYGLRSIAANAATHLFVGREDNAEYLIPTKLTEKYQAAVLSSTEQQAGHNSGAQGTTTTTATWKIDRSAFVVLNPFTLENVTLEKLSSRKAEMILKAFRQSFHGLQNQMLLLLSPSATHSSKAQQGSLISAIFSRSMSAFLGEQPRRDTFLNSPGHGQQQMLADQMDMLRSPRDVFFVEVSQLWHEILYCNFILNGVVSESALLSLCSEVLSERRILPVGEVGKVVSDIIAAPTLSSQLKEKFGGLKKFLERYPEIFVFSKDHPFNPHVVLRQFLTQEQFEMVEAGGSLQSILKASPPGSMGVIPLQPSPSPSLPTHHLQQQQQSQQHQQHHSTESLKRVNPPPPPPLTLPHRSQQQQQQQQVPMLNVDRDSRMSFGAATLQQQPPPQQQSFAHDRDRIISPSHHHQVPQQGFAREQLRERERDSDLGWKPFTATIADSLTSTFDHPWATSPSMTSHVAEPRPVRLALPPGLGVLSSNEHDNTDFFQQRQPQAQQLPRSFGSDTNIDRRGFALSHHQAQQPQHHQQQQHHQSFTSQEYGGQSQQQRVTGLNRSNNNREEYQQQQPLFDDFLLTNNCHTHGNSNYQNNSNNQRFLSSFPEQQQQTQQQPHHGQSSSFNTATYKSLHLPRDF